MQGNTIVYPSVITYFIVQNEKRDLTQVLQFSNLFSKFIPYVTVATLLTYKLLK